MPPPQNPADQIRAAIGTELQNRSLGVRSLEQAIGLKRWCLRGIMDSSRRQSPSLDRADEICRALGITLTLGAGRDRPRSVNEPLHSQITALPPRMEAVGDRQLAELLARLADWWESADPAERARLAGAIEGNLDLVGAEGGRRFAALSRTSGGG